MPCPDALPGRGRRLFTCGLLSPRSVCPVHQPFQFLRGLSWEPDDRRDRALRRTRPGKLTVTPPAQPPAWPRGQFQVRGGLGGWGARCRGAGSPGHSCGVWTGRSCPLPSSPSVHVATRQPARPGQTPWQLGAIAGLSASCRAVAQPATACSHVPCPALCSPSFTERAGLLQEAGP